MSYRDIDDKIKKIIEKADRIVHLEQLEKDRIETLTALREEDGRIKHAIIEKREELETKEQNLIEAKKIWSDHKLYFELLEKYTGEELQDKLHEEIDDYSWVEYSKLQDRIYKLTQDKSVTELQKEIDRLQEKVDELEQRRSDLVDNSLLIIKELDNRIEKYKS